MPRRLVYIPDICEQHHLPMTFLHFSYTEATGAYCLRHYPSPHNVEEVERQPAHGLAPDIFQMAGQYCVQVQHAPDVTATQFWYDRIQQLNDQYIRQRDPLVQCRAALQQCQRELQQNQAALEQRNAELEQSRAQLQQHKANQQKAVNAFIQTVKIAIEEYRKNTD